VKLLNERYKIIKKISETHTSFIYLVEDIAKKQQCILKMLNRNVATPYSVEYFMKEYCRNALLAHPLICNPYEFETCVNIDGNVLAEHEYFFCTPFYELHSFLSKTTCSLYVKYLIGDVMSFLHDNGFHHGDICPENIWLVGDRILLTNLRCYASYEAGQKEDLARLSALFRQYTTKDLMDIMADRYAPTVSTSDSSIHLSIIAEALTVFSPPLTLLLPDAIPSVKKTLKTAQEVVFTDISDVRTARLWMNSVVPECEILGYRRVIIDTSEAHEPFSVMKKIIHAADMYERTHLILQEYGHEFCKIVPALGGQPRPSSLSALDEEEKMNRLSLYLINELASLHPVLLIIPDWEKLDPQSIKLLRSIKSNSELSRIKILAASSGTGDLQGFEQISCPKLNQDEFTRIVRYYFYYYTFSHDACRLIYTITGGDLSILADGFQKALREDGLCVAGGEIHLKKMFEYYFDITGTFSNLYTQLDKLLHSVLGLVRMFGGSLPIKILRELPKKYKKAFDECIKRQLLAVVDETISFRYAIYSDCVDELNDLNLIRRVAEVTKELLREEPVLLKPYRLLLFIQGRYDEYVETMESVLEDRKKTAIVSDVSNVIWPCLMETEKFNGELSREHRFTLYDQLILYNNRFGAFTVSDLLAKLRAAVFTADELLRYRTAFLKFGEPDERDITDVESFLCTVSGPVSKITWNLISAYVNRMTNSGFYEKAIQASDRYMSPYIDTFDVMDKIEVFIRNLVLYFRIQNRVKAWEYLEKIREVMEAHPDRIDDNCRFVYYNSHFAMLQQEGKYTEALNFADKAIAIAESVRDYRKLALVYNNMGVLLSTINQRKTGFEMFTRSLENAFKGKIHDWILLGTGNIMEYYLTILDYAEAKKAYLKAFPSLDHSQNINQRSHILVIGAWLMYDLGDFHAGDDILAQCRILLNQKGTVLYDESFYQALEFRYTYRAQGREAALRQLNDFTTTSDPALMDRHKVLLYTYVINELFYLDEKELLIELLMIIGDHKDLLPQEIDYNNIHALLTLLRIWAGLDHFKKDCVSLGNIEEIGLRVLYHYLASFHTKDTLMIAEHVYQCRAILHAAYSRLSRKDKKLFLLHSKLIRKYEPFLAAYGYSITNGNLFAMRRSYVDVSLVMHEKKRLKNISKNISSQLSDPAHMIRDVLNDARDLSGFSRAIYFEYTFSGHWIKRAEVYDSIWYKADEAYADNLLAMMIESGKSEILYSLLPHDLLPLTVAAAVPIIDIGLSRQDHHGNRTKKGNETPLNRLMLRGVLYVDSKFGIMCPSRETSQYLTFTQDKMNMILYFSALKKAMLLDPLTGLYKRETWLDMVKNVISSSRNHKKRHAIVITDIDYFKKVNDIFGHKAGDNVLCDVAHHSMAALRMNDIGGRFGGEEFTYCLIDTTYDNVKKAVERIRHAVQSAKLLKDHPVSISAGYAVFPDDGVLLSDLIEKADQALLFAKKNGRNRCIAWQELLTSGVTPHREKIPIIENYSRETEKIDLIIALIDTVSVADGLSKIIIEIRNICIRYLEIDDVLFIAASRNEYAVYPSEYYEQISITFPLKETLFEDCSLFASYGIADKEYGVYLILKKDSHKALLEKRYYSFLAEVIAGKAMSAILLAQN